MKNPILIILLINLLVYSLAFGIAHLRHQSVKVYVVFLAIQGLLLLLQFLGNKSSRGSNDAMGSGMSRAFAHIFFIALQAIAITIVFIIFIVRQLNIGMPVQLAIIAVVIALLYFFLYTDYKIILTSWFTTSESKLTPRNGVMYTAKGKPFTGTSIVQGELETYPRAVTAQGSDGREYTTRTGVRTTQYQNGLKEGEEKLHYTNTGVIFNVKKSELHCITHYHQGLKQGMELINYDSDGYRQVEAQYANGVLHGLYKEYYWLNKYLVGSKAISKDIGPLKLEMEYKNGVPSGIYRTYSEVGEVEEDYVLENGAVLSGRKKTTFRGTDHAELTRWEFYENGKLQRTETYRFASGGALDKTRSPLDSEVFYENGEIIEERVYSYRTQKVKEHRIRVNGKLVEIFNSQTGVDRTAEFGYGE